LAGDGEQVARTAIIRFGRARGGERMEEVRRGGKGKREEEGGVTSAVRLSRSGW